MKKEEMNFSRSQQELGNMIIPSVEETKWNQLIEILGLIVIENIELKDSTN
ncbi:hypothetical protein P9Z94_28430 [Bacillus thuringiensis]|uniref:hypothetical protein n=1 Tax=Bacillus thuringiensis TaxID=1428 RepID=UPI000B0B705B|nr:hypothetical protein [Bacillus thuringiensis]MEC3159949.1 hypothetical protein [Bacillus thuringiensis]